jgi:tRNA(fMet)-specific endonuclease VapC
VNPTTDVRWLLDTNILAEPLRPEPDRLVLERLREHRAHSAVPVTAWQELNYGWLRMAAGRRRDRLGDYLHESVLQLPILPLDTRAAGLQAEVRAQADRSGRPLVHPDSEIAAIAIAHGLTLVTRNLRDFSDRPGLRVASWFQP